MRSTQQNDEDLSTAAKIRKAAIECFAEHGFRKTTVRQIALHAGVSPGLVIHHFGSKDQLRSACDEEVFQRIIQMADQESDAAGFQGILSTFISNTGTPDLDIRYLGRSLTENSPAGQRFAKKISQETARIIREGMADGSVTAFSDPDTTAALMTTMSLSFLALPQVFSKLIGSDMLSPQALQKIIIPSLELFTFGYFATDEHLQAAQKALSEINQPSTQEKEFPQ